MGEGRKKSIPQVHSIRRTARSTDRRSFPSGFPGIPINNPPKDNERESEHNRGLILTQSVHVRRVILIVILVTSNSNSSAGLLFGVCSEAAPMFLW